MSRRGQTCKDAAPIIPGERARVGDKLGGRDGEDPRRVGWRPGQRLVLSGSAG